MISALWCTRHRFDVVSMPTTSKKLRNDAETTVKTMFCDLDGSKGHVAKKITKNRSLTSVCVLVWIIIALLDKKKMFRSPKNSLKNYFHFLKTSSCGIREQQPYCWTSCRSVSIHLFCFLLGFLIKLIIFFCWFRNMIS